MREKVKNGKGLMFFMCVGPTNPWEQPTQLLFGILLIILIYMLYRVLGAKYPKYRSDMKAIATVLSVLIALGTMVIVFFTGTLC